MSKCYLVVSAHAKIVEALKKRSPTSIEQGQSEQNYEYEQAAQTFDRLQFVMCQLLILG